MLSFPAALKVYLCTVPCDMRRSFDGLSMMAEHIVGCNPLSGHLFVFFNRRRDRTKILFWDRSGLCLYYKRLERGVFRLSALEQTRRVRTEIEAAELALILEGIDLSHANRRARFVPRKAV